MSTITAPRYITSEELLAMPDDGIERWIIRGELREGGVTRRSHGHSRLEAIFTGKLFNWLEAQPDPRGVILVGEAGFRLRRNPETIVGIDVAYISAEMAAANPDETRTIDGPPILAVEILSPSDTHEIISEKITDYLESGVKFVWIVDPRLKTVTVYRPDAKPVILSAGHELTAEPHLPGFKLPLVELFRR